MNWPWRRASFAVSMDLAKPGDGSMSTVQLWKKHPDGTLELMSHSKGHGTMVWNLDQIERADRWARFKAWLRFKVPRRKPSALEQWMEERRAQLPRRSLESILRKELASLQDRDWLIRNGYLYAGASPSYKQAEEPEEPEGQDLSPLFEYGKPDWLS